MMIVLILLSVLGIWQLDFVVNAIESNVFLNSTIFGTFFFGVFIAFRNVMTLDNEVLAFNALKQDHDDAVYEKSDNKFDTDRRHNRSKKKAIIFNKPKIIAQPFNIISEEIARTGRLNLSTGVIQNILDSIDDRLDEKKSLVQYVTGILVFLGLIGTFVGLMVTLGSVGMIIGGIDLSGDGGAEAIQGLMTDLQIPLQGMATGFSSSLFGLITSLALGLMTRFSNQSSNIFRAGFETWLAGLASIGNESRSEGANAPNQRLESQLSLMLRVARLSMVSNTKLVSSIDNMAQKTQLLIDAQTNTEKSNFLVSKSVSDMIDSHVKSNEILAHVADTLKNREELRSIMIELQSDTGKQTDTFDRVNTALSRVIELQIAAHENLSEKEKEFVVKTQLDKVVDEVNDKLSKEFSGLSMQFDRVDSTLTELDNNLGSSVQNTNLQLSKLASDSKDIHHELIHSIAENKNFILQKLETINETENELQNASLIEQQRRLFNHYIASQEDLTDDQPKTTKKSRFNFLKRSA